MTATCRRLLLALLALVPVGVTAQTATPAAATTPSGKKILGIEDYTRWRTIEGAQLSEDGKWLVFGYRFANTLTADAKPVLHLRNIASGTEIEIADASQANFSPDSKWLVYQVDPPARRPGGRGGAGDSTATPPAAPPAPGAPAATPPAAGGRGGTATAAPARRWELRELATGRVQQWKDVANATFSVNGTHLLLRRRAAGSAAPTAPRGSDAVLVDLATGRSLFLGSVADAAFNRTGERLAYTVDAAVRDGNGLFLVDLKSGRTDALDNDSLRYYRLAWNEKGTGLAVLKGREVEKMRERSTRLMVFTDLTPGKAPALLDPATATGFPKGFVISDRSAFDWSDDGSRIFFSILPQSPAADTGRRKSTDSLADVDVWRTQDERIQSVQMVQAESDRSRSFRQGFDIGGARFIALADSAMRELDLPLAGEWAVGRDPRAYISDYKRPAADFYRVNTRTGERVKVLTGQLTGQHVGGISSDGRFYLFWKNSAWQAWELATNTIRPLPAGKVSFVNTEFDNPGPRPSYGITGYASDGSGVIVPTRFDLWFLPFDSAGTPRNLTGGTGTAQQIVFRLIRPDPIDSSVRRSARVAREYDLGKPLTLSAYGEFTKKSGFYRLADGKLTPLVYEDAAFSNPTRTAGSDLYLYTRQTFSEYPDLLLAKADLASPRKVTDANPQQGEYRWGKRILFDYVTRRGDKLQGILALPEDYQPGQKLPMLVTFYEKNSQTMHRYPTPSYLTGMGGMPIEAVSRGYATMLPDVFFHTGSSHSDMLDAVEAATKKVIAMGYVDPKRIGVHGHSYGGEGAAFIGTRSKMFAAVGMGAGVTDLFTDFNQSWGWSYQVATGGSGANGNDYYLFGQGRWGFSPWDKPEVYHFESALTHVPNASAPFLIMHGTADPTVSFSEGMNFYNALRYNGKNATLLAYTGEGHGLRGLANRKDLTVRYFEFFDHYLKGTPAPKWMTEGVPFLVKDAVR